MRHIIAHLVRGEANDYLTSRTKDLVNKFDVFPIHNRIPFHLTLKRWFKLSDEDMQTLHVLLDNFVQSHTQSDYAMNKFGNFREDVLFLDVEPSEKMQRNVLELMDVLHTHPNLTFDEYDNGGDFHATLTMSALKPFDFRAIRDYLNTIAQPDFKLKFDNIAILKKPETVWVVDRVWELEP
jgi:2'-5' RNA ligase